MDPSSLGLIWVVFMYCKLSIAGGEHHNFILAVAIAVGCSKFSDELR